MQVKRLVVLISFSGQGGVERMVMNLVRQFAASPHISVDLLLIRAQGPYFTNIPANVNIIQLNAKHTLTSIPELARYLKKNNPEAMLVAKDRAGRAALIAKMLSAVNTRIVIRLGTNLSTALAHRSAFNRWLRTAPMRHLYPLAHKVIAVSEGVRQDTLALTGLMPDKVHVVRNPVITDELVNLASQDCPHTWLEDNDIPVVLGMGRLSKQKDFPTLIYAFAQARKTRAMRLIILGEGGDRPSLERLIHELELEADILMPGFDANPYRWLSRANIFVLSSLWEGSPNALTEALALAVPSISTRCPSGPNETLAEGRYGSLIEMGNVEEMAEAIIQTLKSPLPADDLKEAVAEYKDNISAKHYLNLLEVSDDNPLKRSLSSNESMDSGSIN